MPFAVLVFAAPVFAASNDGAMNSAERVKHDPAVADGLFQWTIEGLANGATNQWARAGNSLAKVRKGRDRGEG